MEDKIKNHTTMKHREFKKVILGEGNIFRGKIKTDNKSSICIKLIKENMYIVYLQSRFPCTPKFRYNFDSDGELLKVTVKPRILCCFLIFGVAPFVLLGAYSYLLTRTLDLIMDSSIMLIILPVFGGLLHFLNILIDGRLIKREFKNRIREFKS